jgi:hypothetical protein
MVPKELTKEQKQRRVNIFQDLLESQDDILIHVITRMKHGSTSKNSEMKQQSSKQKTANSPQPKKFRQSKSRVRTVLLAFIDITGIALWIYTSTPIRLHGVVLN